MDHAVPMEYLIITTKSGQLGKSKVDFRASYGMSKLANDNGYGVMTPEELVTYMRDAVTNSGFDPDDPSAGNGRYYRSEFPGYGKNI